jgi:electron transfer flavoprotein beta subunit
MNIIVCIKQVPSTTNIKIDYKTGRLIRDGVESVINSFDECALEEGVKIKEKTSGKVTVITMGPPQAEFILREAISRGADDAILVSDKAFGGADTLATAYTLSLAIKSIGNYQIIVCGKQASDGDTGQVGPGIAEMLNIPHISYVKKIELVDNNNLIRVERVMEDGYDLIESQIPVLLTVVKEINSPRMASLKNKLISRKSVIKIFNAKGIGAELSKIGIDGSPTNVLKIFPPKKMDGGEKFRGEAGEVAALLVKKLVDLGIV